MWLLILLGGGILVVIIGPINISGFGDFDLIINSGIKAIIAVTLVIIWILVLSKLKNWIFRKEIKS
jgi:hypothetical protein